MLIKTLLFSGARINEFVNIKVSDVSLSDRKIYIRHAKGGKSRYVPILSFYFHELSTYIGDRTVGYLFESRLHNKYSERRVQQIIKDTASKVGIEKRVYPHMLRRTIATWLADKGAAIEDIKNFLGHSKFETTEIYTRGSVKNMGKRMEKVLLENKEAD